MSIQVKVTGNVSDLKKQLEDLAEDELRVRLNKIAADLILLSPVYPSARFSTGAYVNSHSVNFTGSGGGYGYSSDGKGLGSMPEYGTLVKMQARIEDASFEQLKNTTFRNNSPHAADVEYGGPDWRRDGYHVYEGAAGRNR